MRGRGEECDQICDLFRIRRPTKRNATQCIHDDLLAAFQISTGLRSAKRTEASVAIHPGDTRTTRIPLDEISFAIDLL